MIPFGRILSWRFRIRLGKGSEGFPHSPSPVLFSFRDIVSLIVQRRDGVLAFFARNG